MEVNKYPTLREINKMVQITPCFTTKGRETYSKRLRLKQYAKLKGKSQDWFVKRSHVGCVNRRCTTCKSKWKKDRHERITEIVNS